MSATIDRIMDAAESAMRLRGYHAVSFRDLADELGIKSASVHYHFRQKEDLGLALVERYSQRFFEDLEKRTKNSTTPNDYLKAFCNSYKRALSESGKICLCGLLGAENPGLPEKLRQAVAGFFDANITWVTKALPATLTSRSRKAKATQIVATLHGALMLATSLQNPKVFDAAANGLLVDLDIGAIKSNVS